MKYLLAFLFLFAATLVGAQDAHLHCGTDEMHRGILQMGPQLAAAIAARNEVLDDAARNFQRVSRSNDPYIIPVVFHVIHNFGPENISDSQIHDAVEQVNLQLRKLNPDTGDILPEFQAIAADTEIEIRLARKDPDGLCTNGITRTASALTNPGDHSAKSLIQWPPDQYLNIYVCADAAGLAGHAVMPAATDTIPEWDGIVMRHDYVGTIGTSNYFRRTVLTHEIGHYLNLQHIWGGNNVPGFFYLPVANPNNCNFDDGVDDTPNTIGWQSCNLQGNTCGSLDNVQNYMDYAYCARMFTEGQRDRMHATLNSPVAGRNNLWQPENLEATGVFWEPNICMVDFEADKRLICAGESVQFNDLSYHGITSWSWTFEGGTPEFSSTANPLAQYNQSGDYDVSIVVSTSSGFSQITRPNYIRVMPGPEDQQSQMTDDFETESLSQNQWFFDPGPDDGWVTAQVGFNSAQSLMFTNSADVRGRVVNAISQPLNLSEETEVVLSFKHAYAKRAPNNNDRLRVYRSTNCGSTWIPLVSFTGNTNLETAPLLPDEDFVPASESDWTATEVNLPAALLSESVMFRVEFLSDGGNFVYIDDFYVGPPGSVNVEELLSGQVDVFPVPFGDWLHIRPRTGFPEIEQVELIDMTGRTVLQSPFNSARPILQTSSVPHGAYLLRMHTGSGFVHKKILK